MKALEAYLGFWRGPIVSAVQVARFRLLFFALLAYDGFLLVAQAPRYGAGGFNVPHFPSLGLFAPVFDRTAIVVCALVMSYLAARVAIGVAARWLLYPLAAIYAIVYLGSQLDSFQHHFLVVLILAGMCITPWQSGASVRLILVQVSVVYLFAAVSKMAPPWWDGRAIEAMASELPRGVAANALKAIGYAPAAKLLVLTELFLAVAIHVRVLRLPVALLGIALHASIELAGFKIGLFSYYMFAIYLLVLPPGAFRFAALPALPAWRRRGPLTVWLALGIVIAIVLIATLPLDGAVIAAVAVTAAGLGRTRWVAVAHVAAAALMVAASVHSDAIRDHYRYWGGAARRLGDLETSQRAYERLRDHEPSYAPGRRNLGKLYLRAGRGADALVEYRAAAAAEPEVSASQLGLALAYEAVGESAAALVHAKRARDLAAANGDRRTTAEAAALLSRLDSAL